MKSNVCVCWVSVPGASGAAPAHQPVTWMDFMEILEINMCVHVYMKVASLEQHCSSGTFRCLLDGGEQKHLCLDLRWRVGPEESTV